MTQRRHLVTTISAITVAFVMVLLGVVRVSSAGFSANTTTGSGWTAGSVSIKDDDTGLALFSTANEGLLDGGSTTTKCIAVTYDGTLTTGYGVRLYGTASGTLAPYLNLTVEEGTGGGYGSCAGFTGTGTIYTGTLADFAATKQSFDTGVSTWAITATPQTRTYRITTTVQSVQGAQAATANARFFWTAQMPPPYPGLVAASNPSAYWRFDTVAGSASLTDSSGNARTLIGSAPAPDTQAVGTGGGSAQFPVATFPHVTNPTWLASMNAYSVEAWVKTPHNNSNQTIISMDNSAAAPGNASRRFQFYLISGAPTFMVFTTGGGFPYATTASRVDDGTWHHLVGTNDGTTLRVYVDGTLQATQAIGGTQAGDATSDLVIGSSKNGTNYTVPTIGSLDEVAIYPGALTPVVIDSHAHSR